MKKKNKIVYMSKDDRLTEIEKLIKKAMIESRQIDANYDIIAKQTMLDILIVLIQ